MLARLIFSIGPQKHTWGCCGCCCRFTLAWRGRDPALTSPASPPGAPADPLPPLPETTAGPPEAPGATGGAAAAAAAACCRQIQLQVQCLTMDANVWMLRSTKTYI